ncbi:MAG TPA: thrombospondin type 3 repeat-containing protein [Phycisphaerales bacterium]|nr:thrombospondin type 3 repeat-containing protein [Phycisphaerales bacterium]
MNANPSQQDSNNNGIGDACDSQLDADNDGVLDFMDNCPFTFNPGQEDFDADGVGDVCDNCPVIPNPLQEDVNMNGIGDVCESSLDNDGDGFSPQQGDCDDTNPNVNPIHPEICGNLIDDDCDGLVDEGCP